MKKEDIFFTVFILLVFLPFFISEGVLSVYEKFNSEHGFIMSFIKFAILATSGELLGLRIRTGRYFYKGFGILPRMMVWGFLGITIKAAFMIFATGVPSILVYLGVDNPSVIMASSFSVIKLLIAFSISLFLNLIYAPVLMTAHKITDTHIQNVNGSFLGFFGNMNVAKIMEEIDWNKHWGFVLKKTIPLFWIPAHTVTFLLPPDMRVLFAALLGILLGVILAIASKASPKQ